MTADHDHDGNVEAFGLCPVCDTLLGVPTTPSAGEAAAAEAVARAVAAAPDGWTQDARMLLRMIAATDAEFTTDDLWARLTAPPEPRAMGGIIRWGAEQGLIVDTGRSRKSTRTECHARPVTIWAGVALPDG